MSLPLTPAEQEVRHLHEILARLQEEYAKAAKPYIDRLAEIKARSLPPPMTISVEQAQANGLISHRCHAGKDGDCIWHLCPQERDGEPVKTGRHCPLDKS